MNGFSNHVEVEAHASPYITSCVCRVLFSVCFFYWFDFFSFVTHRRIPTKLGQTIFNFSEEKWKGRSRCLWLSTVHFLQNQIRKNGLRCNHHVPPHVTSHISAYTAVGNPICALYSARLSTEASSCHLELSWGGDCSHLRVRFSHSGVVAAQIMWSQCRTQFP